MATADLITLQHGDGERAESGLHTRVAIECSGGRPYEVALLQVESEDYKRIRKKKMAFERRLLVQPA